MNQPRSNIPFYRQMISLIRNALYLLDEQGQGEVFRFLVSRQNADGGFQDRGGRSDLYYSLFGMMMLKAWGKGQRAWSQKFEVRSQKSEDRRPASEEPLPEREAVEGSNPHGAILKLKQYVTCQQNSEISGFIEKCCLALLQKELKVGRNSRFTTFVSLGKSFWKERYSINVSYRSFVLFLTLDATLSIRWVLKFGAKRILLQTTIDQHSPCSEVAAKVFLQKMMNQNTSEDQKLLLSFACNSGGFRAFQHLEQPDMLSTAVALFALDFAGRDLRLLKPACLDFIQQNFIAGAFLSGDGDQTKDLEYTFYGLLALGVLAD
jgi:hypothetical protein